MNAVRRTARASRQRGFVVVTMLVSMVALLAFLGLGIDVGYEEYVKTRMQTAADAAAMGGAQELRASGSTNLVMAAKGDAAANGFTDGANAVTITVNNPPATGYSTADASAVEVLISQTVPSDTWRCSRAMPHAIKAIFRPLRSSLRPSAGCDARARTVSRAVLAQTRAGIASGSLFEAR